MKKIILLLLGTGWIFVTSCRFEAIAPNKNLMQAAQINTQLGLAYLKQREFDLSYQKLKLAAQQDPDNAEAWLALAYYQQMLQHYARAEAMYQKALALAPTKAEVLNNYGAFCCLQRKFAEAQQYFTLALKDSDYTTPEKIVKNQAVCKSAELR